MNKLISFLLFTIVFTAQSQVPDAFKYQSIARNATGQTLVNSPISIRMSIVEGFGGMRVSNDALHFSPKIPNEWKGYSFKINFRNQILKVSIIRLFPIQYARQKNARH